YNPQSLPTSHRPEQVKLWLKHARKIKSPPCIARVSEYSDAWCRWWMSMQPEWRKDQQWPPSRDVPADTSWVTLLRSGPIGFFLIVVSLSWWAERV
ncbi:hypothetical protein M378DRAFT_59930, partial [Amanita muscaria Koide BX008]